MKNLLNRWELCLLGGIILLSAFVYRNSFSSRFFQDDRIAMDMANSGDWLATVPGVNHYRPVTIQLFYGLSQNFFGLNPVGYHLVEFAAYCLTIFFIYALLKKILKDGGKAMTGTFIYALNVSLFGNFYWIATSYFSIGALFFFAASYLYLRSGKAAAALTLLTLAIAILSNELALTLPFIFLALSWYFGFRPKRLIGSFALAGLYFFAKLKLIGMPQVSDYSYSFNSQVLATARWYFLRAFNLPEGVRFSADPLIPGLFLVFLILIAVAIGHYFFREGTRIKVFLLAGAWFGAAALPFFFLPMHMSAYYLTMALFSPALLAGEVISVGWLRAITLPVYLWLTVAGLEFLSRTHWIILKNTGPIGKF